MTQSTKGMSTPLDITSVHINTPLQKMYHNLQHGQHLTQVFADQLCKHSRNALATRHQRC